MTTLKQWTGKANTNIINDSTVDEFIDQGLLDKVKGKQKIAQVCFTVDGDVFGGFFSVVVMKSWERFHDPNVFIFSF